MPLLCMRHDFPSSLVPSFVVVVVVVVVVGVGAGCGVGGKGVSGAGGMSKFTTSFALFAEKLRFNRICLGEERTAASGGFACTGSGCGIGGVDGRSFQGAGSSAEGEFRFGSAFPFW
jgi:hypothetical protein